MIVELPKWTTFIMALKRKFRSGTQLFESHQSTSSFSIDVEKNHLPVSATGEENEMSRKRRRMDRSVELRGCDWSDTISDQNTGLINERSLEDQNSLHEPLSSNLEVLPPADQQAQTHSIPEWCKPISEESDSEERQRKKSSFGELLTLHWSSNVSYGQGQKVEGQTIASISERHAEDETKRTSFIIGRKRKQSSRSAQVYDSPQSTDVAENHQHVGEENGMQRKRRRMDRSVELRGCDWSNTISDQNTGPINERSLDDQNFLQEPLSSNLEVLPPADQQAQTPSVHEWFKLISEESDSEERQRKKSSFGELLTLHWSSNVSYGQGQKVEGQTIASISKRHAEDQNALQYSACALEDHGLQEAQSSGPKDQQVQAPAAPVHQSPVSPAPGHNHGVDATTKDIFSRYKIGSILGKGGFGSVYEGKRLKDGLEVAVKIAKKLPNMDYINVPGHPAPLPLEVGLLILANRGPKVSEIIELLDWQDEPDQYIMVLERPSACKDLYKFWTGHRRIINEDTARFIMLQTTSAAHMCVRRGVFHRDIKLQNLLINTNNLKVKLIDFGCGELLQESGYKRFSGTLKYRPPEYLTGKYHGKPATVWSLGVLLFLMVCGRFPEPRDREMIDNDTWFKPGLSNECCLLIRSLLKGNPQQRICLRKILRHEWFNVTE